MSGEGATTSRAASGALRADRGSRVSARWRIVGWIVLTTSIALLAVVVTMRSLLLGQVAQSANEGITQEIEEFRTFAHEGVDPQTAQPFASEAALMQRYLSRQTPATHEAFIAVSGDQVHYLDNAADDAGERLAADAGELESLLGAEETSGIRDTAQGAVRWGRVDTADGSAFLVLQFTDPARGEVDQNVLLLIAVAAGGVLLTALIAWFAAGQILQPVRRIGDAARAVTGYDLSARIPVEGRDDISRAAQSVNDMLDRLEAASERRRHIAVEARRHLSLPLESCRRELAELDTAGAARVRATLSQMQRTLSDLDLLEQAHTPGALRREPTAAALLLVQVRQAAAQSAPDVHWVLEEVASETVPMDGSAVRAALLQLTRNAAQHTAPGDQVRVFGTVLDGTDPTHGPLPDAQRRRSAVPGPVLRLGITNPGRPLHPEQARAMVEDYRSAARSLDTQPSCPSGATRTATRSASADEERTDGEHVDGAPVAAHGMGLGLAVARAVADAHGGSLWVESHPDGRTSVGLDLPLRSAAEEPDLQDEVARAMQEDR